MSRSPTAARGRATRSPPALGGERRRAEVSDPLRRPIEAEFALAGGRGDRRHRGRQRAWAWSPRRERDAVAATTAGTGELIAAAIDAGARTVYLGVGGSATTDGGAGAIKAIERGGGLRGARLVVLCDVRTPFEDAAAVFASPEGRRRR